MNFLVILIPKKILIISGSLLRSGSVITTKLLLPLLNYLIRKRLITLLSRLRIIFITYLVLYRVRLLINNNRRRTQST